VLGCRLLGVYRLAGVIAVSLLGTGCGPWNWSVPQKGLTSVEAIRLLPAQPLTSVPVHLHGVITYGATELERVFLQDSTGGVRLANVGLDTLIEPGNAVDVTGTVVAGGASPLIACDQIRRITLKASQPPR
jgi:hypothetical protein